MRARLCWSLKRFEKEEMESVPLPISLITNHRYHRG